MKNAKWLEARNSHTLRRARYVQERISKSKRKFGEEVKRLSKQLFVSEKTIRRDAERDLDQ